MVYDAFTAFVEKYSGNQPKEAKQKEINGCTQSHMISIDIEHITGKEAIKYGMCIGQFIGSEHNKNF